ncbi:hypothetical protein Taro_019485 [Colocasia esculenta]|uniref:Uncharacterized protein n=1 Tax=Colocasia esculenta TaxID=4460 RepID=A0A843V5K6_COLES|nr:hypothetical protein [Colocasia esculenta]
MVVKLLALGIWEQGAIGSGFLKTGGLVGWELAQNGGGPALSSEDYCIECLKEEARNSVSADDYRGRRNFWKQIAEAALAGNCPDGIREARDTKEEESRYMVFNLPEEPIFKGQRASLFPPDLHDFLYHGLLERRFGANRIRPDAIRFGPNRIESGRFGWIRPKQCWFCPTAPAIIVVFISLPSRDDPLLHLPVRLSFLRLGPNTRQVFNHEPLHFSRHRFTTLDIMVPCKPPTCKGEKWGRKGLAARHLRIETTQSRFAWRRANLKGWGVSDRGGSNESGRIESNPVDSPGSRPGGGSMRITHRAGPDSLRFGRIGPIRPALSNLALYMAFFWESARIGHGHKLSSNSREGDSGNVVALGGQPCSVGVWQPLAGLPSQHRGPYLLWMQLKRPCHEALSGLGPSGLSVGKRKNWSRSYPEVLMGAGTRGMLIQGSKRCVDVGEVPTTCLVKRADWLHVVFRLWWLGTVGEEAIRSRVEVVSEGGWERSHVAHNSFLMVGQDESKVVVLAEICVMVTEGTLLWALRW